jgi:hypothetical protein
MFLTPLNHIMCQAMGHLIRCHTAEFLRLDFDYCTIHHAIDNSERLMITNYLIVSSQDLMSNGKNPREPHDLRTLLG